MDPIIHDRGRGPEIVGSRITVYDVLDYAKTRTPEFIADLFRLKVEQIHAALAYIEEHREEVMVEYREMLARAEAGNPPEIQELAEEARRLGEKLREILRARPERFRTLMKVREDSPGRFRELVSICHAELFEEPARAGSPR